MAPSRIRHFVHLHDGDGKAAGFRAVKTWRIATNKRVRDLAGDWVWMLGKDGDAHYLFGRFRIDSDTAIEHPEFKYEISGKNGVWFSPAVRVDERDWFEPLRKKMANFNTPFAEITDEVVLDGMRHVANPPATAAA